VRRTPPVDIVTAAEWLGTTVGHMYRLVERRAIAYTKVGGKLRFLEEDLEAYLMANRVEAAS
jgi:excisionase family DNA binding protein